MSRRNSKQGKARRRAERERRRGSTASGQGPSRKYGDLLSRLPEQANAMLLDRGQIGSIPALGCRLGDRERRLVLGSGGVVAGGDALG